ncbi:unnamed protein product [marine sediment metagenome]|uniref:Phosphoadenosine phosphosulphate reductase domain-containing protein n=1 Tax=marine sediment metagenome TaxID=412755 RepID=X1H3S7_9ZZZZ
MVFFDTGWEFPGLLDHIDLLERKTGIEIVRLKPDRSFDAWMTKHYLPNQNRIGYGWPSPKRRWCTREKFGAINKYCKPFTPYIECIGFAADEFDRTLRTMAARRINKKNTSIRFPLIEWKITEADALKYCYEKGYDWGGLYKVFHRVSCFCCPLQRIGGLKKLRKHFPDLWKKMLKMDSRIEKNRGFRGYKTVHNLEERFADEEKQLTISRIIQ